MEASKQLLDRSQEDSLLLMALHLYLAVAYVGLGRQEEAQAHAFRKLVFGPSPH